MRPPLRAALLLAVLLGAAASPSLAQGGVAPGLSLDPSSRTVDLGANATTDLVVSNDGLATMNVTLDHDASPLEVLMSANRVTVAPRSAVRVHVHVNTTGLAPGNYSVTFRAREQLPNGFPAPTEGTASFLVHVVAPPPGNDTQGQATPPPAPPPSPPPGGDGGPQNASEPTPPPPGNGTQEPPPEPTNGTGDPPPEPPAPAPEPTPAPTPTPEPAPEPLAPASPIVTPSQLTLASEPGKRVGFQVEVANPTDEAQTFDALLRLPLGWAGSLDRSRLAVPAHGRVLLAGSVQPLAGARDAEATLALRGPGGESVAQLSLLALPPPEEPPASDLSSPAPLATRAAPASAPGPKPPAPPPAGRVTLRIEPAEVRVAPGQRALAHLVVENGLDAPLAAHARLALPDGFQLEGDAPEATVPPGETLRLALVLRADGALEPGAAADASASLDGLDASPAPFRLVVAQSEPVQDAAPAPAPLAEEDAPWLPALVATAAGGVALACAWAWRRWQVPLLALYARLKPDRILDHPARAAIRDLVHAEPGIRLADLQRRAGLANGALRHHVSRLESAGHLRIVRDGPHRRLWPPAAGRVAPAPGLAERALRVLHESGPMPAPALAARLGVSRQALHYHVKRLAAQGRLDARLVGRDRILAARAPPPAASEGGASP